MAQDTRTRLENRIKKLQQLHDLLGDPDISAEVESLYSHRNGATVAEPRNPPAMRVTTRTAAPKRSKRGQGRKMTRQAVAIVNEVDNPITARDVADRMTAAGFSFKAGNKYIAVSKALRRVSEDGEIEAHPGASPKAPIFYLRKKA